MIRKLLLSGMLVVLLSVLSLCLCYANDDLEKLMPNIVYESEQPTTTGESVDEKVRRKTGKDEVIVRMDKITKSPHSIIASGLEVSSQDKVNIKSAIDALKSKRVDKKMRLKGEALSDSQQKIDIAARVFIRNNKDILLVNEANLKLINMQKVRNKAYVTYQQYYNGIPVYQAIVKLIISREGKIPSLGSDYHKDINISTTPAITESQAIEIAKQDAQFNQQEDKAIFDGLLILPLKEGNAYTYHLAYKLAVSKDNPEPACWVYFIDAHAGEILVKYNDIRHATISGKVTGLMLPRYCNAVPQRVPFRDEYVSIKVPDINQAITDKDGNYTVSFNMTNYLMISTSLEGPWVKVINESEKGTDALHHAPIGSSADNIGWNINWDSVGAEAEMAEMNVFYHINKIHDYVKNTLKYDGMDWQIPATVNIAGITACYSPLCRDISLGTPSWEPDKNYALSSDTIYHEYTHAATEEIYEAVGSLSLFNGEHGAIGEGLASYFACSIIGDSVHAEGLINDNKGRDLDNTLIYPDDLKDQVHADGMIIGGAFWDLRKSLGKELADDLIHNARFGCPQNFSEYLLQILIVDDDNGNIFDGTQHEKEIKIAFKKHGITLDTTQPTTPVVSDEGIHTFSLTQLTASWSAASDTESGIKEYQYMVGTANELKVALEKNLWKSAGNRTSITVINTVIGLSIISGNTYYFAVKAINGTGLSSEISLQKKGITIISDKIAPKIAHTPIKSAKKNKSIAFTAVVKDDGSGVQTVTLYWRKEIKTKWGYEWSGLGKKVMTLQGNDEYKAALPASQIGDRKIWYYINVKDKAGNTAKTAESIINLQ